MANDLTAQLFTNLGTGNIGNILNIVGYSGIVLFILALVFGIYWFMSYNLLAIITYKTKTVKRVLIKRCKRIKSGENSYQFKIFPNKLVQPFEFNSYIMYGKKWAIELDTDDMENFFPSTTHTDGESPKKIPQTNVHWQQQQLKHGQEIHKKKLTTAQFILQIAPFIMLLIFFGGLIYMGNVLGKVYVQVAQQQTKSDEMHQKISDVNKQTAELQKFIIEKLGVAGEIATPPPG